MKEWAFIPIPPDPLYNPRPILARCFLPSPYPLLFLYLPNCYFRNSLVFIALQMPRGYTPPASRKETTMAPESANPSPINESPNRCTHHFPNGTRCRLSTPFPESPLCLRHASLAENQQAPIDHSEFLTDGLADFRSAYEINELLSRLLRLLAQDRISTRRAAVMAYITNQLLHILPAMNHEDTEEARRHFFDSFVRRNRNIDDNAGQPANAENTGLVPTPG